MANENSDNHEWDCAMCGGPADLRGHRPCAKTGYNELRITRCFKHGENKWTVDTKKKATRYADDDVPTWVKERGSYRDANGRLVDLSGKAKPTERDVIRRMVPQETGGARRAREAQDAWGEANGWRGGGGGSGGGWQGYGGTPKKVKPPEPKVVAEPLDDELAALIKSTESEAEARIKADNGDEADE